MIIYKFIPNLFEKRNILSNFMISFEIIVLAWHLAAV